MTAPGPTPPQPPVPPAPGVPFVPSAPPAPVVPTQTTGQPTATPPAPPTTGKKGKAAPPPPPRPSTPGRPAKSSGGRVGGAYLLAFVSLVVALAATAGAVYAWKTARDLRNADAAAPTSSASATPTAAETTTPPPTAESTTPPPAPSSPSALYVSEIDRAEVVIPSPSGCLPAYVDVDTANTGAAVAQYHDFYFSVCQGTLKVHVDRTSGRAEGGVAPTPDTCDTLMAGTPTTELVLDAQTGVTFCLRTNKADADAQGLPQRLAIVEVLATTPQVRIALSVYHRAV